MALTDKRLFLLDMDGTIYLDDMLFNGVLEFLDHVKVIGGRCMYLTNNSSKSVDKYIEKMASLGIPAVEEDFFTSTNATVLHLKKSHTKSLIYALGTASFKEQLRAGGLDVTSSFCDGIDCLVAGFDTELTFQKLEDACILLSRGVDFIATNPDWICPTWYGYVPDCGSVCEMLFRATGRRPVFIGKPQPEMALLAIEKSGFYKDEALLVGDRIYTDIACGVNAGISTALVLSGETTREVLNESEVMPEYVFDDINALLAAIRKHV